MKGFSKKNHLAKKVWEGALTHVDIAMSHEHYGAWTCLAASIGVDRRYPDIGGDSSIQELQLAIRLIRRCLGRLLSACEGSRAAHLLGTGANYAIFLIFKFNEKIKIFILQLSVG